MASDAEIDQHDAVGSRVNHQVGRLQVAVNDRFGLLRMDVIEHVTDIYRPFGDDRLINFASGNALAGGQVATVNVFHDEIIAASIRVEEILVDRRDGGMVETGEQFSLAFEILDG